LGFDGGPKIKEGFSEVNFTPFSFARSHARYVEMDENEIRGEIILEDSDCERIIRVVYHTFSDSAFDH